MLDVTPAPVPPTHRWSQLFFQGITVAALALALAAYIITPFLAYRWIQLPFIGGFVEQTHLFNDVGSQTPRWDIFALGYQQGDRLIAIDGQEVTTDAQLNAALAHHQPGNTITLTIQKRDGDIDLIGMFLKPFPFIHLLSFYVIPYVIGLFYLGIGSWIFWQRRQVAVGRLFALFCAFTAITMVCLFDFYTTHIFTWIWTFAGPLAGASAFSLALIFPQEWSWVQRYPQLRMISFVPGILLPLYTCTKLNLSVYPAYYIAFIYQDAFVGLSIVFFLLVTTYRLFTSSSPLVRGQSRVIWFSSLSAFSLLLIWVIQLAITGAAPFNAFNLLPLIFFPIGIAYALLRYRLLGADQLISRSLTYVLTGAMMIAGYTLFLWGLNLLIVQIAGLTFRDFTADNPLTIGVLVLAMVVLFIPLRDRLQRLVDLVFFRSAQAYDRLIDQFGDELTRASNLTDIYNILNQHVGPALRPAHLHLFVREPAQNEFVAYAPPGQPASTDIRFAAEGALATHLEHAKNTTLYLAHDLPLPLDLHSERPRLALTGSLVYAPLAGKARLNGWLALGAKLSGEPYHRNDIQFLEVVANQTALAIERANVIGDLEGRVKELNVLSQISQAVSFTIAYDDLLELISAQTGRIVDTRNFYIVLKDLRRHELRTEFYVENDERVSTQENRPWPADLGLESEVVRTGQPLRTEDYLTECRRRDLSPGAHSFKAWLGVPLNAGAETIGVMCVGATDPSLTYTAEQMRIVSAIADQAASALVKAQLYQQANQRARQLATLNEISASMATTLELDPLLQRIVQSSVDILACEAGSLFLIDTEADDYIFSVAIGPVGQNLVGSHLPKGRGFVGEAIEAGQPLIVNDVQNDPRWFKGSDQSTGFITRALMVVPLKRGDNAIGAVEVINKADGSPFDDDDKNLLTAFAGPATITIENARLFTLTDEALNSRVEELSVMQRIDRELNTTLDVQRVMNIALEWAMKRTHATAGAVGMVSEIDIHVIATAGYAAATTEAFANASLPLDQGLFGRVVSSGDVLVVRDVKSDPDYQARLAATQTQLVLPVKRENKVIALLSLESPDPMAFTIEEIAFVVRLMDHASAALTNARLFTEVEAGNVAKSDQMRFVAHELNNPMTSVKGFSDLLLAGAVGPLNDMQKQFLTTIRDNTQRVIVIINDLNDAAKLEAGTLRMDIKATPFQNTVEDVVRGIKPQMEAKKQILTVEVPADLPLVWVDPMRVHQVLLNLISNAHKYTQETGEILLRAAREPNQWDASPTAPPEVVHVWVKDNGVGLSPEDQKKVFTKFFCSDDPVARGMARGVGLGLNIVRTLVERQGGKIWFESELRKGSTFHFTVPIVSEPAS